VLSTVHAGGEQGWELEVFALLLFALATWILIMAWMSRHAYYPGQYPFPSGPGHP